MEDTFVYAEALTSTDCTVLKRLAKDIQASKKSVNVTTRSTSVKSNGKANGVNGKSRIGHVQKSLGDDSEDLKKLKSFNDPAHELYEQAVFMTVDTPIQSGTVVNQFLVQPYIQWAKTIVRHPGDTVMLTHLIMYFTTSVPSALYLYWNFTYLHGILHFLMQMFYVGTFTLMMHQHIHMRGILQPKFSLFDHVFPYILNPMFGHTQNSYYYHHVKHHHVEGNGPDDLSSTIRYQRDELIEFLHYLGRFFFLIWMELPLYFFRKNRPVLALQAGASEIGTYCFYYAMSRVNGKATVFVYLLPLLMLRLGLMVGNWGQHALVDADEPDSDYRSSITLIDGSNKVCFNDGYHTSHHLNPLRHWRQHPISFLEQRHTYAAEGALVFHNIDYIFMTIRLLMKDYEHLAKCLVPIGDQVNMTMEQRVEMLKKLTRRFTEEEIDEKFRKRTGAKDQ